MARAGRLKIFVDSGAWIALNLPRDALHQRATRAYEELPREAILVTTTDVYDEAITRSRYDGGLRAAESLRRLFEVARQAGRLEFVWATPEIFDDGWEILRRNAALKLSFTDATSAAVARMLRIKTVFGFDADFRALGFELIPT